MKNFLLFLLGLVVTAGTTTSALDFHDIMSLGGLLYKKPPLFKKGLTKETWDDALKGKTVFIAFVTNWCGWCKRLKPEFEKLKKEYEGNSTVILEYVVCEEGQGIDLCRKHDVYSYPAFRFGDSLMKLEEWDVDPRTYENLKEFVHTLGPMCSPRNKHLCDEETNAFFEKFERMSNEELDAFIAEQQATLDEAQNALNTGRNQAEKMQKYHTKAIEDSGFKIATPFLEMAQRAEKKKKEAEENKKEEREDKEEKQGSDEL